MAYAALVSLKSTLPQTIFLYGYSILDCEKHEVDLFLQNLDFLQHRFLDEYPPTFGKRNGTTACLERRIRDAVYEAQDIIDSRQILYPPFISNEPIKEEEGMSVFGNADLKMVIREIDSIRQEILAISKEEPFPVTRPDDIQAQPRPWDSLRANFGSGNKNLMVGYDDLRLHIKDRLTGESSSSLQVISVVGMGGIGKTTLAIDTYTDPCIVAHYDIRAWVTVSQSYCTRNILLDLLDSMKQPSPETSQEDDLACCLYKCLKEKRYFIIIDDIWDTNAWDAVRRMFPNDENGSRIMLTTRINDVAAYATLSSDHIYQMSLLSEDSSWILLCTKVFGSESCPLHDLKEIGKDIAWKCRGLPLSVVVMAGILSKVDKTYEAWQAVAANLTTSLLSSSDDLTSSEILKMSYDYLPQHLKSCFLYLAIFPEDHEIDAKRLVNLWIAEGFMDGVCSEISVEEVGERFLGELIDRSLLSTSKLKCNGKVKTCKIHDLLLDFCVKESKHENILHVTHPIEFPEMSTRLRRLSIHKKGLPWFIRSPASSSLCRSIICMTTYVFDVTVFVRFKLLRVLDLMWVEFYKFPEEVTKLVQLRHLAFQFIGMVPPSLSNLYHLQTLLITGDTFLALFKSSKDLCLPSEIWKMKRLRYIRFGGIYLKVDGHNPDSVLEELETIKGIRDLRFTKELIRRIPNIKKIDVTYQSFRSSGRYEFKNIANLHQLKEFKIFCIHGGRSLADFHFPKSLETLSLFGTEIPWENLSSIAGSLPCLKVLKLRHKACVGEEWEPKEGDFCELKVLELNRLKLKRWKCQPQHFPCLEHLIVRSCANLEEIPIEWGESSTLNKIELQVPREHSVIHSANEIKEIQHDFGNEDFQLCLNING